MSFSIPSYSDLVLEQLDIINLRTDRDWVIQGGPGTGKTVMAIFRAQQVSKYKKTIILVYNRPLKLFLEKAVRGTKCEVKTYNEWISDVYSTYLGRSSFPHVSKYEPDFAKVEQELMSMGVKFDHTIIDEAQDCPIELIRTVKRMSKNITCFVDPNQEILNNKTNSTALIKTICVEVPYRLTRNFRNTKQIRDASALFCQDGVPARSFVNGKKPSLVRCYDYDSQIDYMANFCLSNRESTIGIIVDHPKLNRMYEFLEDRLGSIMPVQMFKTMSRTDFDFSKTGVQIFSYGTMKGLEFDHVIVARIDDVYCGNDAKKGFNQIYVATSRPRDQLKITYYSEYSKYQYIDAFSKIKTDKTLFDWEVY